MEKHLILMRHAKSAYPPGMSDFERPLSSRGETDAFRMGEMLRRIEMVPDRILCSSARRARETADLLSEACGFHGQLKERKDLYLCETLAVIEAVQVVDEEVETLLVVAHNPTLSDLVGDLISTRTVALNLTTAAMACLSFDLPWYAAEESVFELKWFMNPKLLKKMK